MILLLLLFSNRKHTFLQLNPMGIEITMGEEFHLIIALQLDLGYLFIGPFSMYLLHLHEELHWNWNWTETFCKHVLTVFSKEKQPHVFIQSFAFNNHYFP